MLGVSVGEAPRENKACKDKVTSIAAALSFITTITSRWSEMTGSSPGLQPVGEPGSSSSGHHRTASNEEEGNDDVSGHKSLHSTLLDDDPLGDLSQPQFVVRNYPRFQGSLQDLGSASKESSNPHQG